MSVQLRRLTLSNFASFGEAVIDLPEKGVVLINGINDDTRGSSGSGKSSLALAIPFALGYSPVPGTQLQRWGSTSLSVALEMDSTAGRVVLTRGQGVSMTIAGKKLRGSAAAIEAKLQELHGLQPHFLEVMTYRRQKKPGVFLDLEPSKKLKFLTKLLGLEKFEEHAELARKESERRAARLEALSEARTAAQVDVEQRGAPQPPVLEDESALRSQIALAQADCDQAQVSVDRCVEAHEVALRELKASKPTNDARMADVQTKWTTCQKLLSAARQRDKAAECAFRSKLASDRQTLARARTEIGSLGSPDDRLRHVIDQAAKVRQRLCHTCNQTWSGEGAREEIRRLADLAQAARNDSRRLQELRDRLPSLEAAASAERPPEPGLTRLEAIEDHLAGQLEAMAAQAQEIAEAEEVRILSTVRQSLAQARQELSEKRLHCVNLESDLRALLARNSDKQRRAEAEASALAGAIERLATARSREQEELTLMAEERDFALLVGKQGYLGSIFDEVLEDIGLRASALLSSIPNVAHCSFALKSSKATQTGERKGIVPVVTMGEERSLETCSGGMITSIELAVDLAVSSVLAERTGARPSWLILDEPFDGLDQVSKEACLELLREVAEREGRLVLVIDHVAEFKEMFEQVVTVRSSGGNSRIEAL